MDNKISVTPDKKTVVSTDPPVAKKRAGAKGGQSKKGSKEKYISIKAYDSELFRIKSKNVNVIGKQILGSRKNQQDSFAVSDGAAAFSSEDTMVWAVVCDGMGGMAGGEVASATAVEVFKQVLSSVSPSDSIPDVLAQAVGIANEAVREVSRQAGGDAGTTLVCVVIKNNKLYYASVGDSRIYISRGNEFLQVTRDHNYLLELKEKFEQGEISEEEMLTDPQKEALISYIGIDQLKIVDINSEPIELQSGDVIILCSDGLPKVLNDAEIFTLMQEAGGDIEKMVDSLLLEVTMVKESGLDNTTIAAVQYINE